MIKKLTLAALLPYDVHLAPSPKFVFGCTAYSENYGQPRSTLANRFGTFAGGGTIYRCFALATLTATNDFARTQSCWQIDQTTATGYCYKDTVGDWYCGLLGTKTEWQANVLPPAGS
jgi:hypothetical protein